MRPNDSFRLAVYTVLLPPMLGVKNVSLRRTSLLWNRIIYADKAVVVINKPSGLVCQSNAKEVSRPTTMALADICKPDVFWTLRACSTNRNF